MANDNPQPVTSFKSFLTFAYHFVYSCHVLRGMLLVLLFLILLGGVAFAYFEGIPYSQGIYFSLITSSTVGFGDITPKTGIGQCISVYLAFIGTILFGLLIAVATRALTESVQEYVHVQGNSEPNT